MQAKKLLMKNLVGKTDPIIFSSAVASFRVQFRKHSFHEYTFTPADINLHREESGVEKAPQETRQDKIIIISLQLQLLTRRRRVEEGSLHLHSELISGSLCTLIAHSFISARECYSNATSQQSSKVFGSTRGLLTRSSVLRLEFIAVFQSKICFRFRHPRIIS